MEEINPKQPVRDPCMSYETESDISDRCFVPEYTGDSRKWLIRDAAYKLPKGPLASTMKDEYRVPMKEEQRTKVGKRRALIQQKFMDEITERELRESREPPPIEKYCSTYDLTFQIPGFRPKNKTYGDCPELYEKYPLYSSSPMSFWQYRYETRNGNPAQLHGFSSVADVKKPFKRNSAFSTPVTEVLDDIHLL